MYKWWLTEASFDDFTIIPKIPQTFPRIREGVLITDERLGLRVAW